MVTTAVDPAYGGRWTSLRGARREWLWHRPDPARRSVRPGDAFVDAGGLEECVPTVRGVPDHGSAWSAPWADDLFRGDDFTLRRRISQVGDAVVADYALAAKPGFSFVWAAHALLDLSPAARLIAPAGVRTRVDGVAAEQVWPLPLAALGPDDGTAVGAILLDCPAVTVDDGDRLSFRLEADGQPVSTALWRNLGGWPPAQPYRSIGVEPMLGRVFDRALAGPGDLATVPPGGVCGWRLTVTEET